MTEEILEFLLVRFAEAEATLAVTILAEYRARRAIVERFILCSAENEQANHALHGHDGNGPSVPLRITSPTELDGLEFAVRALAAAYRNHPDYDDSWGSGAIL